MQLLFPFSPIHAINDKLGFSHIHEITPIQMLPYHSNISTFSPIMHESQCRGPSQILVKVSWQKTDFL